MIASVCLHAAVLLWVLQPAQFQGNDSLLNLNVHGSSEATLLRTLIEQGLLQLPQLLQQQESRYRELWRALDQRFQQQVDGTEARLSLRLESLKGDLTRVGRIRQCLQSLQCK